MAFTTPTILRVYRPPWSPFLAILLYTTVALAQAPVSDLTQYPSGLASIAVVCYYAIASDKDNLSHRRRVAGFGAENLARDLAHGPRRRRDAKIKGITFTRAKGFQQRTAWGVRMVGDRHAVHEVGVPPLTREELLGKVVTAFEELPEQTIAEAQARSAFGTEGHWLAGIAAFCQAVSRLEGGAQMLEQCREPRNDLAMMRKRYESLEIFVTGKTNAVEMPDILGKPWTELEDVFVRADTWVDGGRPVDISCSLFIRILGHCVGYSYGELMAGAHLNLAGAKWAGCLHVHFLEEIENDANEDQLIEAVTSSLKECVFYKRECDMRVWGHRFGDLMASLVSDSLIACLVTLGSSCGTWVAVTASAIADPKPVAGLTSAAWGYPKGRRAHMEARSRPAAGYGAVCLKTISKWTSFRRDIEQDIVFQVIIGIISFLLLFFKYPTRSALGFGPFAEPQLWITWLGLAAAALGTTISVQIPIWAWSNGRAWSFLHGCIIFFIEVSALGLRLFFHVSGNMENRSVWSFWVSDLVVWLHNLGCCYFSIHRNESTDYPMMAWIWPTTWLFAVATAGAGVPQPLR